MSRYSDTRPPSRELTPAPHSAPRGHEERPDLGSGDLQLLAPSRSANDTLLIRSIRADQSLCWQRGEGVKVEDYCRRYPALATDEDTLLDLIYNEILLREDSGETPTLAEYLQRFPRLEKSLRQLFDTHGAASICQPAAQEREPGTPELLVSPPQLPAAPEQGSPPVFPSSRGAEGLSLPGYEVLEELGRGGMGVVYKVWQTGLNRIVAVKMFREETFPGPEGRARFRQEAEAAARLQHPDIVQIYEVNELAGRPYFSLEYVPGGNLAQKLGGRPLPPRDAAWLAQVVARAIHYAHQRGIVHRDLKPANILLTEPDTSLPGRSSSIDEDRVLLGSPKITDFGLAKFMVGGTSRETHPGSVLGTPCYMSPEQARGRPAEVGPASDVYAIGATLYEMLAGHPPFQAATAHETLWQVQHDDPVPLRHLLPRTPRDLETICLKCLQKDPRKRYASAFDLAEDLRRFLDREPIRARPVSKLERLYKWARRQPLAAALSAFAIAAVLTITLVSLQMNRQLRRTLRQEDAKRFTCKAMVEKLRADCEHKDYRQAIERASTILAFIGADSYLDDQRDHVMDLRRRAQAELNERNEKARADNRFREFLRWRDQALFHGTLFIGVDVAADREATRRAAARALELYAVTITEEGPPQLSATLDAERKDVIATGCYELLLILAEAVAAESSHPQEALDILDRAAHLGLPPTRAYHLRRAQYLSTLGWEEEAREERALAEGRSMLTATDCFLVGEQLYRQHELEAARQAFEQALRREANHVWGHYFLALCRLKQNAPAEARAHLTAALGSQPELHWARLLRAYASSRLGDAQAVEDDFRAVADALRSDSNPLLHYGLCINRGAVRLEQGKAAEAEEDFRAALTLVADPSLARINLAHAYLAQKRHAHAIELLTVVLARAPHNAHAYRLRALAYRRLSLPERALTDLARAASCETDPHLRAGDHLERGQMLYGEKQYTAALEAFAAALADDSGLVTAQRLHAETLLALGRGAEAVAALDRYLKQGARDAYAYRLRGFERARGGDYAGSLADLTRALEIEPASPRAHASRGRLLVDVRLAAQQALGDFEAALKAEPANARLYCGRGYARALLGDVPGAVADAEQALCLGPLPERRDSIEAQLELAHNAACIYAQVAAQLTRIDTPQPRQQARTYQELALGLIRANLRMCPVEGRSTYLRLVREEPGLASLWSQPEFHKLLEEPIALVPSGGVGGR